MGGNVNLDEELQQQLELIDLPIKKYRKNRKRGRIPGVRDDCVEIEEVAQKKRSADNSLG